MRVSVLILVVTIVVGSKAAAQVHFSSNTSLPKGLILYDPLFWKDELKLSSIQQRLIDKINTEFYENIKAAHSTYTTQQQSSYQAEIADLLSSRSEQIWETFRHRQKRKWEKLDLSTTDAEGFERTQSAF